MKSLCASSFLALVVGGCSFDPGGTQLTGAIDADPNVPIDGAVIDGSPIDGSPIDGTPIDATPPDATPPDGPPPDAMVPIITDNVAHVFLADEYGGATVDADLTLSAPATIDTSALTISGVTLPAGVTFLAATQDSTTVPGPEIAILHVDDLTITAAMRVIGTRPLVVVSSGAIVLTGSLDAGARRDQPGAGGYGPGAGPAPGLPGEHRGTWSDSGGGGGGYATVGGRGGHATCGAACSDAVGGAGGGVVSNNLIGTLRGGSGGGAAAASVGCTFPAAGAGGGAVQLYAAISITLDGTINVGGGGGGQGEQCTNYSSASGGGAAGGIYLQTPMLAIAGALYANGGGGGGSAGSTNNGTAGANGDAGTFTANGVGGGPYGRDGGDGGGSTVDAQQGVDAPDDSNGGGGGGSEGRIAIRTKVALGSPPTASPVADLGTY